MAGSHKIRVKREGNGALVKMLLRHSMETGIRKHPLTGAKLPRHFIQELHCERNGKVVFSANWGWGIAKNPFLSFRLREVHPGDQILVIWKDNFGNEDSIKARV